MEKFKNTHPHSEYQPSSDLLENLPDYQGGPGRHKCPACAYEAGFRDGILEGIRRAQAALQQHYEREQKGGDPKHPYGTQEVRRP